MSDEIRTLMLSSNVGHYTLVDETSGVDISTGDRLEVLAGGYWISGRVEHGAAYSMDVLPGGPTRGCFFVADEDGSILGLCIGMKARLL